MNRALCSLAVLSLAVSARAQPYVASGDCRIDGRRVEIPREDGTIVPVSDLFDFNFHLRSAASQAYVDFATLSWVGTGGGSCSGRQRYRVDRSGPYTVFSFACGGALDVSETRTRLVFETAALQRGSGRGPVYMRSTLSIAKSVPIVGAINPLKSLFSDLTCATPGFDAKQLDALGAFGDLASFVDQRATEPRRLGELLDSAR